MGPALTAHAQEKAVPGALSPVAPTVSALSRRVPFPNISHLQDTSSVRPGFVHLCMLRSQTVRGTQEM